MHLVSWLIPIVWRVWIYNDFIIWLEFLLSHEISIFWHLSMALKRVIPLFVWFWISNIKLRYKDLIVEGPVMHYDITLQNIRNKWGSIVSLSSKLLDDISFVYSLATKSVMCLAVRWRLQICEWNGGQLVYLSYHSEWRSWLV